MPTTTNMPNGTMNSRQTRKAKQEAQTAALLANRNGATPMSEQTTLLPTTDVVDTTSDVAVTKQEGSGDDTTDTNGKADARYHGPYTTEEEARSHPVTYVSGKKAGECLGLYMVSLDHYPTQYWYGMNYHHAAKQHHTAIGGTVSMCGSGQGNGRGKAVANANAARDKAIADAKAAQDAVNSQRSGFILQMVQMVRGGVPVSVIQDAALRAEVEAYLLAHTS